MLAIIDYGMGNLRSVGKALEAIGEDVVVTKEHKTISKANGIILPGVGAFGDAMVNLQYLGLDKLLTDLVMGEKKPILGICLGMQLISKLSYEHGNHKGLGWINCNVERIPSLNNLRIPHVGWNDVIPNASKLFLFEGLGTNPCFYFVHSYAIQSMPADILTAECSYGNNFIAAFSHENIAAVQFHPEKSQKTGQQLLKNVVNWMKDLNSSTQ